MLKDAIDSVLRQSYDDFELIVVDDGSTDGTGEWLATVGDPRIRTIAQQNAKRGAARNRGVAVARGRYIAFLDDDDAYEPRHLERVADAASDRADAFYSDVDWWDPRTGARRPFELDVDRAANPRLGSLWGAVFPLPGIVAARDTVISCGAFPDAVELDGSEDFVFLARLSAATEIRRLSPASVRIRQHDARGMLNADYIVASRREAMRLLLEEGRNGQPLSDRERSMLIAGTHHLAAAMYYEAGQTGRARKELSRMRRNLPPIEGLRTSFRLWTLTWLGRGGRRMLRRVREVVSR